MSRLQLSGTILYPTGPWGTVHTAGVSVEIIQTHWADRTETVIWSGNTDNFGHFSGLSAEWRRTISVGDGLFRRDVLDAADVLALKCHVREETASINHETTQPFVWIRDFAPSPPVVVIWPPPFACKGRVNGADCWSFSDLARQASHAIQSGRLFSLEVNLYGPNGQRAASDLHSIVRGMQQFVENTEAESRLKQKQVLWKDAKPEQKNAKWEVQNGITTLPKQIVAKQAEMMVAGVKIGRDVGSVAVTMIEVVTAIVVSVFGLGIGSSVATALTAVVGALVTISMNAATSIVSAGASIGNMVMTVATNLGPVIAAVSSLLEGMGLREAAQLPTSFSLGVEITTSVCIAVLALTGAILLGFTRFLPTLISTAQGIVLQILTLQ